jgi:hypothetical protein
MPVIQVRFKLEKETKGALRYQEVNGGSTNGESPELSPSYGYLPFGL